MFIGLGLISLIFANYTFAAPTQGPVVRLDNAVGHRSL